MAFCKRCADDSLCETAVSIIAVLLKGRGEGRKSGSWLKKSRGGRSVSIVTNMSFDRQKKVATAIKKSRLA